MLAESDVNVLLILSVVGNVELSHNSLLRFRINAAMALKRSRSTYEADRAPYVALGTPVHTGDSSFLPVWKQDVRDESGRRRLHGAFTGGWSAG